MDEQNSDPLVGAYFHSFTEEGCVLWQGKVIGETPGGFYLVLTFDWISGGSGPMRLVLPQDMLNWFFYPDEETMKFHYEYGAVSGKLRPKAVQ